MRFIYKIFFTLFLSSTIICGQQISRPQKIQELKNLVSKIEQTRNQLDELEKRQGKLTEEILEVSKNDKIEADKINAKAVRLFPDGILDGLITSPDSESASVYTFSEIADYYFAPRIEYKNGALEFSKQEKNNLGFIVNLGGTLPQTIDERNPAFDTIIKYEPPADPKEAKSDFTVNNIIFRDKAAAAVGSTYLVRVIRNNEGDGIFALRVHRKDTDGSIILFVKNLKILEPPKYKNIAAEDSQNQNRQNILEYPDYAAVQTVQSALFQKGFYDVSVEATPTMVTLRGSVPKGKMAEAVMTAQEAAKRKVKNELTEK